METNAIFREMALTCLITNFSASGGFERIYLSSGRKPTPAVSNSFRNRQEKEEVRHVWNGRRLLV